MKAENQWEEMAKEAVHPIAWKFAVIGALACLAVLLFVTQFNP